MVSRGGGGEAATQDQKETFSCLQQYCQTTEGDPDAVSSSLDREALFPSSLGTCVDGSLLLPDAVTIRKLAGPSRYVRN